MSATLKVRVDRRLCVGHGRCYMLAPEIYGADERGHCELRVEEISGEQIEPARLGADGCPEQAIRIDGD